MTIKKGEHMKGILNRFVKGLFLEDFTRVTELLHTCYDGINVLTLLVTKNSRDIELLKEALKKGNIEIPDKDTYLH